MYVQQGGRLVPTGVHVHNRPNLAAQLSVDTHRRVHEQTHNEVPERGQAACDGGVHLASTAKPAESS